MNARFDNDYLAGGHPALLQRLVASNGEETAGYGLDPYSDAARAHIRAAVGREDVAVHFLVGGTQTNCTVITAALRPHQAALAARTGHIVDHEAGAIEARGHRAIGLASTDGKISAAALAAHCAAYAASPIPEHIVQPGLVYLSQPTELGTVYQRAELAELAALCRAHGLSLYIDGARLAYALDPAISDIDLPTLAEYADVFSIGGTKCGALFGEAVVIVNPALRPHFRTLIKQQGGLLAKGRLLGLQFEELFRDGLYFQIGREAVAAADRIRAAFRARGVPLAVDSPTNLLFPLLPPAQAEYFHREFGFSIWDWAPDSEGRLFTRCCTTWSTTPAAVDSLLTAIAERC